jgi:hypothetical protein
MPAWHVRLKGYSSKSVTYESLLSFTEKVGYSNISSSQSGTGIFCFVIAAHTFSVLFLRRQWSDRTSYIVLILSWTLNFLELCNEYFILAKPEEKGPYFGIAGYWCWISPAYRLERYLTSYLIMFVSAAFSSIFYLLVFFRLRGNISLSAGYKIYFHRRPKVRIGRTSDGAYIVTDDRRVESHLTRVAKHMLWYPLVYTVLVVPQAAARFAEFSGSSVPFPVTVSAAVLFLLHGFVNTLLFCSTRNILPGSWRQRFGISALGDSGRSDADTSNRTNTTWRIARLSTRIGTLSTRTSRVVLSVGVEKDVEIKYDDAQPIPSNLKVGSPSATSPTSATSLFRTHGGGQRAGNYKPYVRPLSFLDPRGARRSNQLELDGVDGDDDDDDSYLGTGVGLAKEETIELEGRIQPLGRASSRHESGIYGMTPSLEAPAPAHLFTMTRLADINERHIHSSPILAPETTISPTPISRVSGEL